MQTFIAMGPWSDSRVLISEAPSILDHCCASLILMLSKVRVMLQLIRASGGRFHELLAAAHLPALDVCHLKLTRLCPHACNP